MEQVVRLPRLGETVDQVLVIEWLVEIGDAVVEGDPLLLVETDKVEVEVPSPGKGTVAARLVGEGAEVETGAPICVLTTA